MLTQLDSAKSSLFAFSKWFRKNDMNEKMNEWKRKSCSRMSQDFVGGAMRFVCIILRVLLACLKGKKFQCRAEVSDAVAVDTQYTVQTCH